MGTCRLTTGATPFHRGSSTPGFPELSMIDVLGRRKRSVDMEQKSKDVIRQSLTRIGELAAHPAAFGVLLAYALLWFIFDRTSLDWHGFATLAAVFMTLIIQRAEDRDTQALQAKLDELLRASRSADSELTKIDSLEPEDIKRFRNES